MPTSDAAPRPDTRGRREVVWAALIFAGALLACVVGYLAVAVPGAWFPAANPVVWGASDLRLARGAGEVANGELVVTATDPQGVVVISVTTAIRSADYPTIAWIGADLPAGARAKLLWRNEYAPEQMNSVPVEIEAGRLIPKVLAKESAWIGRVTGIALALQTPLPQPIHVRGVVARPMGAVEILADRMREWLAFEPWTGASINTILGGADVQDLPLPLLLAIVVAMAVTATLLLRRRGAFGAHVAAIVAAFFLVAWFALDARWMLSLARQVRFTATQFAGKDTESKHRGDVDGALFDFVAQALQILPRTPVRIVVMADAPYFRARAAYHLFPHSAFFEPRTDWMPTPDMLHPGDWLLVYQRHGVQYNGAQHKLRWGNGATITADQKLVAPGASLFLIR